MSGENHNMTRYMHPKFTAALFMLAKTRKHSCPWINEGIKKIWYMYTMEYSAMKKNGIMPFAATWSDLEIIILSEANQTEKEKYHMIFHLNVESKM